nr:unnamed protein product [Callosobruchus chinensis]
MVAAEFSQGCARNSLVINLDKTDMTCFGNRCRHSMQISVLVDGITIDESPIAEESCRQTFHRYKIMPVPCIYIYKCIMYIKSNLHLTKKNNHHRSYLTRGGDLLRSDKHYTSLLLKCIPAFKANNGVRLVAALSPLLFIMFLDQIIIHRTVKPVYIDGNLERVEISDYVP